MSRRILVSIIGEGSLSSTPFVKRLMLCDVLPPIGFTRSIMVADPNVLILFAAFGCG